MYFLREGYLQKPDISKILFPYFLTITEANGSQGLIVFVMTRSSRISRRKTLEKSPKQVKDYFFKKNYFNVT